MTSTSVILVMFLMVMGVIGSIVSNLKPRSFKPLVLTLVFNLILAAALVMAEKTSKVYTKETEKVSYLENITRFDPAEQAHLKAELAEAEERESMAYFNYYLYGVLYFSALLVLYLIIYLNLHYETKKAHWLLRFLRRTFSYPEN